MNPVSRYATLKSSKQSMQISCESLVLLNFARHVFSVYSSPKANEISLMDHYHHWIIMFWLCVSTTMHDIRVMKKEMCYMKWFLILIIEIFGTKVFSLYQAWKYSFFLLLYNFSNSSKVMIIPLYFGKNLG